MKSEEINLIIREGEGLTVEFKEKYSSRIDRDIVALANSRGGPGIKHMKDLMCEAGLKEPEFTSDIFFHAVFYRNSEYSLKLTGEKKVGVTTQETTHKTTQKIIQLIMENPHITRKEPADFIGIIDDGIKYHLTNMQKKGLLRRVGADKGGHWKVVK